MGRTKGSKNGIRRVPIKKAHPGEEQKYEYVLVKKHKLKTNVIHNIDDDKENPTFDASVLKAFRSQDYEKCIELIEVILQDGNVEPKHHYKILQAASHTMLGKDFKLAHTILDDVLREDPENSFALYGKGVAYYFQKRLEESLEVLNQAIIVNPDEMQRAKEMKVRIDLERRQAVIFLKKVDHEVLALSLPEEQSENKKADERIERKIKVEAHAKVQSESQEPMILDEEFELDVKEEKTRLPMLTEQIVSTTNSEIYDKLQNGLQQKPDHKHNLTLQISKSFSADGFTSQEFFEKGMEAYMCGALKKALKMFGKAVKLKSSFERAEEMGARSQELLELMDMANLNMTQKNFHAVVEILNEALKVDSTNDFVNRPFYFQRGLAYYHLGQDEKSIKDYAEFDRLNKLLDKK